LLNTGAVSFSPTAPLVFQQQLVGVSSTPKPVTLTNTGKNALTISSIQAKGQFDLTTSCGHSLASGDVCTVNVSFSPTSQGGKSGLISIADSASVKPQFIDLSGEATVVKLSVSSLTFGPQSIGTKSSPQKVQLTNTGHAALTISSIKLGGSDPKDFIETNTCAGRVATGASCELSISFAPIKAGKRTAAVSISDSGGASPQTITLLGTGSQSP
jgi:hypothetical protein